MRQAIVTRYLAPTNTRGTRIKAFTQAKSMVVGYDSEFSPDENHRLAAMKLAEMMKWDAYNDYEGGALPNGDYAFVAIEKKKGKKIMSTRKLKVSLPHIVEENGLGYVATMSNYPDAWKDAKLFAAAPELLRIAKAYRNLLRTMAHTEGEVATFHHIESVITKVEGS